MSYYSKMLGKDFDSIEALRHYEGLEAMRRSRPTKEDEAFNNLSADQIRNLLERHSKTEAQRAAQLQSGIDMSAFLQSHPEYEDGPDNAGAMKFYLEGKGIDTNSGTITYGQLEDAYQSLKAGGFLKLKASELKKQEQQAVEARMEQIKQQAHFDEWEAYNSMSMDELRAKANEESTNPQLVRGW